jgi:multidrug efflux pump subunit AcrB
VARAVKAEMERLRPELPPGTYLEVNLDRSVYIEESMKEVVVTMAIALVLVLAVIYLFLGSVRATLIPAVTIPISIVSAFLVMAAMGFSINTLTLLGLVLAIGLVVDDSIVVLENIYRRIEHGEPRSGRGRGQPRDRIRGDCHDGRAGAVFVPISFLRARSAGCSVSSALRSPRPSVLRAVA